MRAKDIYAFVFRFISRLLEAARLVVTFPGDDSHHSKLAGNCSYFVTVLCVVVVVVCGQKADL